MEALQRRTPYSDTDSLISKACDKVIEDEGKSELAREQAKLEQKIIRIILSGKQDTLKANSGQSVTVGDHPICVGCQERPEAGYRVWEWHGHIMVHDDEKGYKAEYIYGNYFQRVAAGEEKTHEDKENAAGVAGLQSLMEKSDEVNARILCRNMNLASKR